MPTRFNDILNYEISIDHTELKDDLKVKFVTRDVNKHSNILASSLPKYLISKELWGTRRALIKQYVKNTKKKSKQAGNYVHVVQGGRVNPR